LDDGLQARRNHRRIPGCEFPGNISRNHWLTTVIAETKFVPGFSCQDFGIWDFIPQVRFPLLGKARYPISNEEGLGRILALANQGKETLGLFDDILIGAAIVVIKENIARDMEFVEYPEEAIHGPLSATFHNADA
jgi:hypothetical protein